MNIIQSNIPEIFIIEPKVFGDERGFFFESFNERIWQELTGLDVHFVQHNHSRSSCGVLRGLHYQIQHPQGKLVRVISGEVFDVAVDIRRTSPTFGKWFGALLSADNKRQMWVPKGFAHGFYVTSDYAEFLYLTTDYWSPEHERCIAWNDPNGNCLATEQHACCICQRPARQFIQRSRPVPMKNPPPGLDLPFCQGTDNAY